MNLEGLHETQAGSHYQHCDTGDVAGGHCFVVEETNAGGAGATGSARCHRPIVQRSVIQHSVIQPESGRAGAGREASSSNAAGRWIFRWSLRWPCRDIPAKPDFTSTAEREVPKRTSDSDAVNAAINKLLGASGAGLTPDSNVGDGAPNIKDQKVTYDGDTVHGQFLTEIAGKDVWITISGHMGQKDGYATFDPTEFKVGGVEVPVSLVNPALQRKLAEERDRLKLSDPAK